MTEEMSGSSFKKWLEKMAIRIAPPLMRAICDEQRGPPRTVALFHGQFYDRAYFRDLAGHLSRTFTDQHLALVSVVSDTSATLTNFVHLLVEERQRLAAVIVLPTTLSQSCRATLATGLKGTKLPLIVLDSSHQFTELQETEVCWLYFDNKKATEKLKRHLDASPDTAKWWVGHSDKVSTDEIVRATCIDGERTEVLCDPRCPRDSAFAKVLETLISGPSAHRPLDIVCLNDDIALGVDDALQAWSLLRKKMAPTDIRVFSFDSCQEFRARRGRPGSFLAGGVRQAPEEIAKEAVQAVKGLGKGGWSSGFSPLSPTLEISKSADAPSA